MCFIFFSFWIGTCFFSVYICEHMNMKYLQCESFPSFHLYLTLFLQFNNLKNRMNLSFFFFDFVNNIGWFLVHSPQPTAMYIFYLFFCLFSVDGQMYLCDCGNLTTNERFSIDKSNIWVNSKNISLFGQHKKKNINQINITLLVNRYKFSLIVVVCLGVYIVLWHGNEYVSLFLYEL